MTGPEDTATEKHFTLPTLTEMLVSSLKWEPDSDIEALSELTNIKLIFKEWLRTVGLPNASYTWELRELLILLVDEP